MELVVGRLNANLRLTLGCEGEWWWWVVRTSLPFNSGDALGRPNTNLRLALGCEGEWWWWVVRPCRLTAETGEPLGVVAWWWMSQDDTSLWRSVWVRGGVMGWVGNERREPCARSDVVVQGHGHGNVWVTR